MAVNSVVDKFFKKYSEQTRTFLKATTLTFRKPTFGIVVKNFRRLITAKTEDQTRIQTALRIEEKSGTGKRERNLHSILPEPSPSCRSVRSSDGMLISMSAYRGMGLHLGRMPNCGR